MAKHGLLILATPKAGFEEEYDHWHKNIHVPEIMETPEFLSCTRFRLADTQHTESAVSWKFMTLYEIETDDLPGAIAAQKARSAAGTKTSTSDGSKTVILTWDQVSQHFRKPATAEA